MYDVNPLGLAMYLGSWIGSQPLGPPVPKSNLHRLP